jgi:hypothetical protein
LIAEIFADPSRLKTYMQLLVGHGKVNTNNSSPDSPRTSPAPAAPPPRNPRPPSPARSRTSDMRARPAELE